MKTKNNGFNFILVMSAAINPNGMPDINEKSISGRENQYIRTLKFYASKPCIPHILFVDNSNWDLTNIKKFVGNGDKISYLSLDENNYPRAWGKGYGEFLLLDRAVDYIQERHKSSLGKVVIVKVTGRFPILNIEKLIKEFRQRKELLLAVDVINNPIYRWLHLGWSSIGCRTIVYATSIDFYKTYLYGRYSEIHGFDGGLFGAESLMLDVWKKTRYLKGVYPRLRCEPRLSGYGGAVNHAWITANNYDGFLAKAKRFVKQSCRWFLPFLWL